METTTTKEVILSKKRENPPASDPVNHEKNYVRKPNTSQFSVEQVVKGIVGPWDSYCEGYGHPMQSGNSYVSVIDLATGVTPYDPALLDWGMMGIVAYDIAEAGFQSTPKSPYIGQINMITASSFCGMNGVVWGYHIARNPALDTQKTLFFIKDQYGSDIPVYSIQPLIDAARALFGTVDKRVYPCLPGSHVICANKNRSSTPDDKKLNQYFWAAIGLGIVENREIAANTFMEDYGEAKDTDDIAKIMNDTIRAIAASYANIGYDQGVKFKEIYVGFISTKVPQNNLGCALVCVPYVALAKNACPKGPQELIKMNLPTWIKAYGGGNI